MASNTGLLNESSNFKFLSIKIGDITVSSNYIDDLGINWDGSVSIYGYCTINDHYDLVNTALKIPGQILIIEYIDNYKSKLKKQFNILSSYEIKEQDNKTIQLKFRDSISFLLDKTFIPKSYKSCTLFDIVNDYLNIECKPIMNEYNISFNNYSDLITLENFIIPINVSFLDFIVKEFNREGIYFYQTKKGLIIGYEKIPETPKYPYTQVGSRDIYGFNIMEYSLIFDNIEKTNKLQKSDILVFNKDTKSLNHYNENFDDFKDFYSLGGVVRNSQLTNGVKLRTKEYLINTSKYNYLEYTNNTEMMLIVPGNIDYSLLYKNIDIKLSGANYTIQTRNSGDIALSGKYNIFRVEDKFIAGHKFIQKISVKRINEGIK